MTTIDPARYGPWAVIAGGSEGVGAAFAEQLADAGLHLVLIARKPGPLEETAERVRARGVEVRTLAVDLTAPDAAARVAEATADLEVGLYVHNAGANTYGHEFVTGDLERLRAVIDLNITAQMALVQLFGAPMRERRHGGILLVGSMAGYFGQQQISVYAAAKAFCRIFAEGLWLEMREHDVDVLELVLGATRTPAMARAGLDLDIPGLQVAESDDVAREGLEHLADGPVWVAGDNAKVAELMSGPDRARILVSAQKMTKRLHPAAHP